MNTPAKFMGLTGTEVHTGSEVVAVDADAKTISVQADGLQSVSYDKLVIAVGGTIGSACGRNRAFGGVYGTYSKGCY